MCLSVVEMVQFTLRLTESVCDLQLTFATFASVLQVVFVLYCRDYCRQAMTTLSVSTRVWAVLVLRNVSAPWYGSVAGTRNCLTVTEVRCRVMWGWSAVLRRLSVGCSSLRRSHTQPGVWTKHILMHTENSSSRYIPAVIFFFLFFSFSLCVLIILVPCL